MKFSAVILAGGQSLRMGQDKAWLEVDGQTLVARALATARELDGVEEVLLSGRADTDYARFQCPVLLDAQPGLGPLAGIERGLRAAQFPLVLVLAVDLPRMTAGFVQALAACCGPQTGVVPRLNEAWEPLAAIYPKRCHSLAVEVLRTRHRAAREFASACWRQGSVAPFEVGPVEASYFENWNWPRDVSPLAPG